MENKEDPTYKKSKTKKKKKKKPSTLLKEAEETPSKDEQSDKEAS